MPFMPDPPPRPNEDYLAKMRRQRARERRERERCKRTNARVPGDNAAQLSPGYEHRTPRIPTGPNAFSSPTGNDTTIWLGTNIMRTTAMRRTH